MTQQVELRGDGGEKADFETLREMFEEEEGARRRRRINDNDDDDDGK